MRLLKEIQDLAGNYHVKSGIYHFDRDEYKQAADFLRKAIRDEPNLTESDRKTARYYLTETYVRSAERSYKKGDLEAAVRDFTRAAEVSPDYPDIRRRLGDVLHEMKRFDEAIEQYRHALSDNGTFLEATVNLAFCQLHAGAVQEAVLTFRRALEIKLARFTAPFERGLRRLSEGMMDEAEDDLREAFLSAPDRFAQHYRIAMELLKEREHDKALEELEQALSINPNYADLHNYRGVALCELERLGEAVEAFRRAAALNPGYIEPRLNLAFALLRAGHYKEAESHLESIVEQDPTQTPAAIKLEELRTGRVQEARRPRPRGGGR
jgi:Tfp pilus assembly protein PilF